MSDDEELQRLRDAALRSKKRTKPLRPKDGVAENYTEIFREIPPVPERPMQNDNPLENSSLGSKLNNDSIQLSSQVSLPAFTHEDWRSGLIESIKRSKQRHHTPDTSTTLPPSSTLLPSSLLQPPSNPPPSHQQLSNAPPTFSSHPPSSHLQPSPCTQYLPMHCSDSIIQQPSSHPQQLLSSTLPPPQQQPLPTTLLPPPQQQPLPTTHLAPPQQQPLPSTHLPPPQQQPLPSTHLPPPQQQPLPSTHLPPPQQQPLPTTHLPLQQQQQPLPSATPQQYVIPSPQQKIPQHFPQQLLQQQQHQFILQPQVIPVLQHFIPAQHPQQNLSQLRPQHPTQQLPTHLQPQHLQQQHPQQQQIQPQKHTQQQQPRQLLTHHLPSHLISQRPPTFNIPLHNNHYNIHKDTNNKLKTQSSNKNLANKCRSNLIVVPVNNTQNNATTIYNQQITSNNPPKNATTNRDTKKSTFVATTNTISTTTFCRPQDKWVKKKIEDKPNPKSKKSKFDRYDDSESSDDEDDEESDDSSNDNTNVISHFGHNCGENNINNGDNVKGKSKSGHNVNEVINTVVNDNVSDKINDNVCDKINDNVREKYDECKLNLKKGNILEVATFNKEEPQNLNQHNTTNPASIVALDNNKINTTNTTNKHTNTTNSITTNINNTTKNANNKYNNCNNGYIHNNKGTKTYNVMKDSNNLIEVNNTYNNAMATEDNYISPCTSDEEEVIKHYTLSYQNNKNMKHVKSGIHQNANNHCPNNLTTPRIDHFPINTSNNIISLNNNDNNIAASTTTNNNTNATANTITTNTTNTNNVYSNDNSKLEVNSFDASKKTHKSRSIKSKSSKTRSSKSSSNSDVPCLDDRRISIGLSYPTEEKNEVCKQSSNKEMELSRSPNSLHSKSSTGSVFSRPRSYKRSKGHCNNLSKLNDNVKSGKEHDDRTLNNNNKINLDSKDERLSDVEDRKKSYKRRATRGKDHHIGRKPLKRIHDGVDDENSKAVRSNKYVRHGVGRLDERDIWNMEPRDVGRLEEVYRMGLPHNNSDPHLHRTDRRIPKRHHHHHRHYDYLISPKRDRKVEDRSYNGGRYGGKMARKGRDDDDGALFYVNKRGDEDGERESYDEVRRKERYARRRYEDNDEDGHQDYGRYHHFERLPYSKGYRVHKGGKGYSKEYSRGRSVSRERVEGKYRADSRDRNRERGYEKGFDYRREQDDGRQNVKEYVKDGVERVGCSSKPDLSGKINYSKEQIVDKKSGFSEEGRDKRSFGSEERSDFKGRESWEEKYAFKGRFGSEDRDGFKGRKGSECGKYMNNRGYSKERLDEIVKENLKCDDVSEVDEGGSDEVKEKTPVHSPSNSVHPPPIPSLLDGIYTGTEGEVRKGKKSHEGHSSYKGQTSYRGHANYKGHTRSDRIKYLPEGRSSYWSDSDRRRRDGGGRDGGRGIFFGVLSGNDKRRGSRDGNVCGNHKRLHLEKFPALGEDNNKANMSNDKVNDSNNNKVYNSNKVNNENNNKMNNSNNNVTGYKEESDGEERGISDYTAASVIAANITSATNTTTNNDNVADKVNDGCINAKNNKRSFDENVEINSKSGMMAKNDDNGDDKNDNDYDDSKYDNNYEDEVTLQCNRRVIQRNIKSSINDDDDDEESDNKNSKNDDNNVRISMIVVESDKRGARGSQLSSKYGVSKGSIHERLGTKKKIHFRQAPNRRNDLRSRIDRRTKQFNL